jgi:hypothetical protein
MCEDRFPVAFHCPSIHLQFDPFHERWLSPRGGHHHRRRRICAAARPKWLQLEKSTAERGEHRRCPSSFRSADIRHRHVLAPIEHQGPGTLPAAAVVSAERLSRVEQRRLLMMMMDGGGVVQLGQTVTMLLLLVVVLLLMVHGGAEVELDVGWDLDKRNQ